MKRQFLNMAKIDPKLTQQIYCEECNKRLYNGPEITQRIIISCACGRVFDSCEDKE